MPGLQLLVGMQPWHTPDTLIFVKCSVMSFLNLARVVGHSIVASTLRFFPSEVPTRLGVGRFTPGCTIVLLP